LVAEASGKVASSDVRDDILIPEDTLCIGEEAEMSWMLLSLAIVLEVAGTTNMKLSQGFTERLPSVLVFVFYGLSIGALTLSLKRIDVSVAYAVWSGLGTAIIAIVGVGLFGEALTGVKVVALVLIVVGVVMLNLVSPMH
jgi:small multidrug resistance pump